MSRSVGLPCRTSPDTDQASVSRLVRFRRSHRSRILRAVSTGIVSLSLAALLGVPSVRPAASEHVAPSAARFAAAGWVGLTGDASLIDDAAFTGLSVDGTLAFGDPIVPPITVPALPGFPTPPTEDAPPAPTDTPPATPEPEPTAPPPADETHPPSEPAPAPPADESHPPSEPVPPPPAEETPPPAEATPPPAEATPPPAEATPPPAETPPPPAETPPPAEAPAGDAARGAKASDFARTLVGKAYRYGAAGPHSFDCSGLTMYVYSKFGVKLPHKASQQFSSRYGTVIGSMSALEAGDLVFFKNTAGRGITHAAIYVGGGKMVSANTPRTGVQLNSIGESYWRKHWAGGLRLH